MLITRHYFYILIKFFFIFHLLINTYSNKKILIIPKKIKNMNFRFWCGSIFNLIFDNLLLIFGKFMIFLL